MVVGEIPWQHFPDALEMEGPVAFSGCSDKCQQQRDHIQVGSPELRKGTVVFFIIQLEKIKDAYEICHREKTIKFLH